LVHIARQRDSKPRWFRALAAPMTRLQRWRGPPSWTFSRVLFACPFSILDPRACCTIVMVEHAMEHSIEVMEENAKEHSLQKLPERMTQARADYMVSKARFSVPVRKLGRVVGSKELVQGVDFRALSGETVAIMGPSGAGKTTLLELLAFQGSTGIRTGNVTLNGEVMTRRMFQKHCAYVPQRDSGWWCLTCRETLEYTASLMLSGTHQEVTERVDKMLCDMGLESCQETRVGNEFVKGLSGGQRRRLSLAVVLLGQPLVLFLDEITSGLDAASAAGIMTFLSELVKSQQIAAISTIHQPSAKVFKSIDKLVLLSAGRVAYSGLTSEVIPYFESRGRSMPAQENPADFVLEQINKDFVDPAGVNELLESWVLHSNSAGRNMQRVDSEDLASRPGLRSLKRQGVCHEVAVLLKRQAVVAFRDPTVYSGRILICCMTCLFFGCIYVKSRDPTQSQVLPRQWLLAWIIGIPTLMSMVYCFAAGDEFIAVAKEVRANNYRLGSYLVAQMFVQLPLLALITLFSTVPAGFGVGGWSWQAFLAINLMILAMVWLYESFAQLLAVTAPHPAIATMGVTAFWLINFLFGGAIVRREDVPWPFRAFAYIAPYGYASRTVVRAEYMHNTFSGAVRLPDGKFYCPNMLQTGCYGITGEEVLQSLSQVIYNISPKNHFLEDLVYVFGVAFTFKVLFVAVSYFKVCRALTIAAPPVEEP